MKINNNGVNTELKKKTLKAARRAYFTRKYAYVASVAAACVALIFAASIFLPSNKPNPDITLESASATATNQPIAQETDTIANIKAEPPLTLFNINVSQELLDAYNKLEGVRKVVVPDKYKNIVHADRLTESLMIELAAGEGPDIICYAGIDQMWIDRTLRDTAQMGYLTDLDEIINTQDDFKLNDYNTDALDSVLLDGKRYYIPTHYYVQYQISTTEKIKKFSPDIPKELDLDTYISLADDFYSYSSDYELFSDTYTYHQIANEFSDIKHISLIPKDLRTEKYFEIFRKNYDWSDTLIVRDMTTARLDTYYSDLIDIFLDRSSLFFNRDYLSNPMELYNFLITFQNKAHDKSSSNKLLIYPDRISLAGTTKGYTVNNYAINANSNYKNEAFNFIKFNLSEDVQTSKYSLWQLAPVNKNAYSSQKQDMIEASKNNGETEIAEQIISIIEGVQEFSQEYSASYNFYSSELFGRYLNNQMLFEDMVDSQNQALEDWFYENP